MPDCLGSQFFGQGFVAVEVRHVPCPEGLGCNQHGGHTPCRGLHLVCLHRDLKVSLGRGDHFDILIRLQCSEVRRLDFIGRSLLEHHFDKNAFGRVRINGIAAWTALQRPGDQVRIFAVGKLAKPQFLELPGRHAK